jgi:hypothetical protein
LEAVIRSHEVRMDGYEVQHNGRCITGKDGPLSHDSSFLRLEHCCANTRPVFQSFLLPGIAMRRKTGALTSTLALTISSSLSNLMLFLILISSQW